MRRLGNTLYITSQGAYLSKEGECVRVARDDLPATQIPIHGVDGIVAFGRVSISPPLLGFCAERGVTVSWFTEHGRFLARAEGPVSGNVLLRRAQYRATDTPDRAASIARSIVIGKVFNQRSVLRRAVRDHGDTMPASDRDMLRIAIDRLDRGLSGLGKRMPMDEVRGVEGDAARVYFSAFPVLLRDSSFRFSERLRRPPPDPVNALLSFIYALLTHDARAALEGVGLDPAVGFLHRDRPGRPGMALDLVEEFRAWFADRLVLTLINRRQVAPRDFSTLEGGGVRLTEEARRTVLIAFQERKREELQHPFTGERLPIGLLLHEQARLMAMHVRGDLDAYPPFAPR
jgi:CRISPR-associated protein Cas1